LYRSIDFIPHNFR